jgi:hypothetical protein
MLIVTQATEPVTHGIWEPPSFASSNDYRSPDVNRHDERFQVRSAEPDVGRRSNPSRKLAGDERGFSGSGSEMTAVHCGRELAL